MDPDKALDDILRNLARLSVKNSHASEDEYRANAIESLEALKGWLVGYGFPPKVTQTQQAPGSATWRTGANS